MPDALGLYNNTRSVLVLTDEWDESYYILYAWALLISGKK